MPCARSPSSPTSWLPLLLTLASVTGCDLPPFVPPDAGAPDGGPDAPVDHGAGADTPGEAGDATNDVADTFGEASGDANDAPAGLLLGAACGSYTDCESKACVEGVCCESPCTLPCHACRAIHTGRANGVCAPVLDGQPPRRAECRAEPGETCGHIGVCDGEGGCRRHPVGTVCRQASCEGGRRFPAARCDGNGTCVLPAPIGCAPYACDGSECATSCAGASGCLAPATCSGSMCRR